MSQSPLLQPDFWGAYGNRDINFTKLSHVIIYQGKNLGDVLLSTPVVESVRSVSECRITVITSVEARILVEEPCRRIFWHERKRGLLAVVKSALEFKKHNVDLFIDLHGSFDASVFNTTLNANVSIKMAGCRRRVTDSYSITMPSTAIRKRHRVEQHLDVLRRLGLSSQQLKRTLSTRALDSTLGESDQRKVDQKIPASPFIIVHPCSRWLFKTTYPDFWVDVIERFTSAGSQVVLTGVSNGLEGQYLDYIARKAVVTNLVGKLTLAELSYVMSLGSAYLGVDTVTSHLASAHDKPGVVLFGPSDEYSWGPLSKNLSPVSSTEFACRPCNLDGCGGGKRSDCLNALDPQLIAARVLQKLT